MTATLRLITPGELSGDTAQSRGMRRSAAISGAQAGAGELWMGRTVMAPLVVARSAQEAIVVNLPGL